MNHSDIQLKNSANRILCHLPLANFVQLVYFLNDHLFGMLSKAHFYSQCRADTIFHIPNKSPPCLVTMKP